MTHPTPVKKPRRKIGSPEPGPANAARLAPLRALLVEDSAADAELVARELRRAEFDPFWKRVETAEALSAALAEGPWDIVIADFRLPHFDGLAAFSLVRAKDADLPFILVSGTMGEETAVAAMKAGVQDYLMKNRLNRLGPVVRRELAEAETRRERKRLEDATSVAGRQWRATFDALREAIILLDREGRILRCNKAFRDIVKKPFQDIIGHPCHEIVHGASQFIPDCPFVKMKDSRKREAMTVSLHSRWYQLTVDPVRDDEDELLFAVHVMTDITDARRAEEDLRKSAERIRDLYERAPCGYHSLDKDGIFVEINETELGWLGYTRGELIGKKSFADLSTALGRTKFKKAFPLLQKGSLVANLETELVRKDGSVMPVLLNSSALRDDQGRFVMSRSTVYDRTELQNAESALRESESRFRELFDNMKSGVVIYKAVADGADFLIKNFNIGAERIENIPRASVVGRKVTEAFPGVAMFGLLDILRRVWRTGTPEYFPLGRYADARHAGWRENYVYRIPTGEIVVIYDDVTERMEALKSLRESEANYRELANSLPISVYEADLEGRITFVNRTGIELSGYSESEFLSGFPVSNIIVEPDRERAASTIRQILASGKPSSGEYTARRKDGTAFPVYVVSSPVVKDGHPTGIRGIVIDISERKRAEAADRRSRDLLRTVIDSTPDWIFVKDLDHRYLLVNRSFAEGNGVQPADMVGRPDTDFWPRELCFGDPARNVRGYREDDKRVFAGGVVHNPDNTATLADGTFRLYDTIKMPLRAPDGTIYGVLGYSRDVTERRAAEAELQAGYEKSRKSFAAAVEAMAAIGEMRDPYTTGHQERVARLACAIGAEIGLPPDQVEEIRIGGLLHDMGKISIPSEILTKPGKLSALEFDLLKTHPRLGYDIVAKANFPPAIAAMVLHHHERSDGSGYPAGLKSDEVGLEAKCLAVADVVEAMSSHRPYRPALGIGAALEEIARSKGIQYDERIVDACLRLFRDKGFVF